MHPVMIRDPQKRRLILQDPAKWRWPERIARDVTRRLDAPARRRDARTLMACLMATIPAPYAAAMQTQPVHMLLGSAHFGLAIAAAKSLILAANGPVRWVFHDDGSLTASDIGRLRSTCRAQRSSTGGRPTNAREWRWRAIDRFAPGAVHGPGHAAETGRCRIVVASRPDSLRGLLRPVLSRTHVAPERSGRPARQGVVQPGCELCRHYAGWFRHGFTLEGLAHLPHERQFERRRARLGRTAVRLAQSTSEARPSPPVPALVTPGAKPRILVAAYLTPPGGGSAVSA